MSNTIKVTSGGPPLAVRPALALYKATIRLHVEFSKLEIARGFENEFLWSRMFPRLALSQPFDWPPKLTGAVDRDLQILAAARLNLQFGIGTVLTGISPEAMRQTAYQRYLTVDPSSFSAERERFSRFFVEAGVYDDGGLYWERSVEAGRSLVPGLTGFSRPEHPEESDVDVFLKTLIRADLLERLESLQQ